MSDIVERLRNPARLVSDMTTSPSRAEVQAVNDMREAADEIVRLRAEVARLRSTAGSVSSGPAFAEIKKDARG